MTNRSEAERSPALDRRAVIKGAAGAGAAVALAAQGVGRVSAQATPTVAVATPAMNTAAAGDLRYQLVSSAANEIQQTQAIIDQYFTPLYPNIKVTVEPQPENRAEQLVTSMIGGNAPDVFDTWRDDVAKYADVDQVLDVQSLVDRDFTPEAIGDFFDWQWADFILPNGIRFGLPKYVNMMAVWYNKDLFEQNGITPPDDSWDHTRYADVAKQLTVRKGDTVDRWGLFFPGFGIDRWSYKLTAWGGNLVDPADNTVAAFDQDPSIAATQWIYDLTFKDGANAEFGLLFSGGTGGVANLTIAFGQGRLAMVEDGIYPFAIAEQVRATGSAFKWGFAPVPPGPAGRHVLGTADGFAIWAGSPNQEAAWELIKFLSGPQFQLESTKITGYLPCRYSLLDTWIQVCTEKYPELAEANLEMARTAMDQGYPRNRALFKKDAQAQATVEPALEAVMLTGDEEPSYLVGIAKETTAEQQSS
jgi:multiple sugar transport system substrate-binding protein